MSYLFTAFKEEEITPLPEKPIGDSYVNLLNNFFCNFVPNNYPKMRLEEHTTKSTHKSTNPLSDSRDNVIKVSWEVFYKDLEDSVKECGFKKEEVENLVSESPSVEVLFNTLAPIYKKMRQKGYSWRTLWS